MGCPLDRQAGRCLEVLESWAAEEVTYCLTLPHDNDSQ